MGARLFAWIGGIALFIGVVLFVKYAFDHDLIPPAARVAIGRPRAAVLQLRDVAYRNARYVALGQTLCATGVLTLYGVSFAGQALYGLYGQTVTFALMSAITAGAFFLAVRMEAQVVAVLGMLGGFLTPVLVSTGRGSAAGVVWLYRAAGCRAAGGGPRPTVALSRRARGHGHRAHGHGMAVPVF